MLYGKIQKIAFAYLLNVENGEWSTTEKTVAEVCAKTIHSALLHRAHSERRGWHYFEGCCRHEIDGACDLAYELGVSYSRAEYIRYKTCALVSRILEQDTLHKLYQEYYKEHLCRL